MPPVRIRGCEGGRTGRRCETRAHGAVAVCCSSTARGRAHSGARCRPVGSVSKRGHQVPPLKVTTSAPAFAAILPAPAACAPGWSFADHDSFIQVLSNDRQSGQARGVKRHRRPCENWWLASSRPFASPDLGCSGAGVMSTAAWIRSRVCAGGQAHDVSVRPVPHHYEPPPGCYADVAAVEVGGGSGERFCLGSCVCRPTPMPPRVIGMLSALNVLRPSRSMQSSER